MENKFKTISIDEIDRAFELARTPALEEYHLKQLYRAFEYMAQVNLYDGNEISDYLDECIPMFYGQLANWCDPWSETVDGATYIGYKTQHGVLDKDIVFIIKRRKTYTDGLFCKRIYEQPELYWNSTDNECYLAEVIYVE